LVLIILEFLLGLEQVVAQRGIGRDVAGGEAWVGELADLLAQFVGLLDLGELALEVADGQLVGAQPQGGPASQQPDDGDHDAKPQHQLVTDPPSTGHTRTSLSWFSAEGGAEPSRVPAPIPPSPFGTGCEISRNSTRSCGRNGEQFPR